ncbi:MAG: hypothetical protein KGO22_16960 [Gammaproteobacteria bacterium]|nr:hypothetical protein [Gammaproteobacteria bacterium]
MDSLIRFDDLKVSANRDTSQEDTFPSAQVIEQLRHRLISPDYHDPVEIKIAVLGEMVYFCYRELAKRRTI